MSGRQRNPLQNRKKLGSLRQTKRKPSKDKGPIVKQMQFTSEGQPQTVNEKGIAMERENMRFKNIFLGLFAFAGVFLCLYDVRDEGMTLEIIGLFKYSGSLVGIVVTVLSVWGICKNDPQVSIKK